MTREEAISWLRESTWHKGEDVPIYDADVEAINMAIEALKQEPCEDVVSRKTIDQNIYDYAESNGLSYANLKNAILDATSVKLTQKWIPVSERLPKDGQLVIVSYPYDAFDLSRKRVLTAWYNKNYGFTCGITDAWMPLPQPYKAEREDER